MSYNLPITPDKGRFLKFGSGVGSRESGVGSRESGDGEMGKWGDGEMGKWGDGENSLSPAPYAVTNRGNGASCCGTGILLWNRHLARYQYFHHRQDAHPTHSY